MILLVDHKKSRMFTLLNGAVEQYKEFINGHVPQRVHEINKAWMRQDKIFRHIENHLHRHLQQVAQAAQIFAKENHISGIIIGGHKELFTKIKKHLPYALSRKVKGTFVTELKGPFNEIVRKAKLLITQLEAKKEKKYV
jgi:peptide subunit release factor 1 (eRF1)